MVGVRGVRGYLGTDMVRGGGGGVVSAYTADPDPLLKNGYTRGFKCLTQLTLPEHGHQYFMRSL